LLDIPVIKKLKVHRRLNMAKKIYHLHKLSKPGFTLTASNPEVIKNHLRNYLCDICLGYELDPEMPDNFTIDRKRLKKLEKKLRKEYKKNHEDIDKKKVKKINKEIVNMYMHTACGAEFHLTKDKQ
jgi:hypothetical protein